MDHRTIYAGGFLLLCASVFVYSLGAANAVPQGPIVGFGSNPIENYYGTALLNGRNGGTGVHNIFSNTSGQDFIITQFKTNTDNCTLRLDGASVLAHYTSSSGLVNVGGTGFTGTLKVSDGSSVTIANVASGTLECAYYIDGYYVHP